MLTSKAVIQKIDAQTSTVRLFQNFDLRSSWSFETNATRPSSNTNAAIFPFVFDDDERFTTRTAGSETRAQMAADGTLLFADDYGVPAGFLIAVLFPQGYVPEVFKFKAKPYIPTGVGVAGASVAPPGHFEVFINSNAKLAAVVFLVTQATYFGFKCLARKRVADFPAPSESPFLNDLYATLGFVETHPTAVTSEELRQFQGRFKPDADLESIAQTINRLLALAHSGDHRGTRETPGLIQQVQDALSNTASAVQLADSYLGGGTVAKLLTYLAM